MILTRTPSSLPSALNDVVADMARMVDGMNVRTPRGSQSAFNWRVTPYSGGSDHMQFIDRKIPGVMLGHSPDYTHHTSDDTPDMVDPVELERSEIVATAAFVYLASLNEAEALDLVDLVGAGSLQRLGSAARQARGLEGGEAANTVTHVGAWEREAVESVLRFHDSPNVREAVASWNSRLADLEASMAVGLAKPAPPADDRVPTRLTRGPLDFSLPASRLDSEAAAWYVSSDFPLSAEARFELVNFIDGERSVTAIGNALSAEFGPVPTAAVGRYLEDLVAVGVVRWVDSD